MLSKSKMSHGVRAVLAMPQPQANTRPAFGNPEYTGRINYNRHPGHTRRTGRTGALDTLLRFNLQKRCHGRLVGAVLP